MDRDVKKNKRYQWSDGANGRVRIQKVDKKWGNMGCFENLIVVFDFIICKKILFHSLM